MKYEIYLQNVLPTLKTFICHIYSKKSHTMLWKINKIITINK